MRLRAFVVGQSQPQVVYEITGRTGDAKPKDAVSMTKYGKQPTAARLGRLVADGQQID
jgi:hypothetical protein